MSQETKRVPNVGENAPSFQDAKDAFRLLGAFIGDAESSHNYQVVDEFFRQAELSAIESANPLFRIRNWLDKIVDYSEENRYVHNLPFGNVLGYTFADFIRDEKARVASLTRDHSRNYRANVKDFLYRITLSPFDEAGVGAEQLLQDLIAEIGGQRGAPTADAINDKMKRAEQLMGHVEKSVKMIRDLALRMRDFSTDTRTFAQAAFSNDVIGILDNKENASTVNAIVDWIPSPPKDKEYGDIHITGRNPDGSYSTRFSMTSDNPSRDIHLMTGFLELEQAARLRKINISHRLGEVLVLSSISSDLRYGDAWAAVCNALTSACPQWHSMASTDQEAAVAAIRKMAQHRKGDTRYCPECGHMGPVPEGSRDCCPDGIRAFHVPQKFAKSCHDSFMLAIEQREKLQSSAKYTLQCREIGEEGFRDCSVDEYCDAVLSPIYDTRILVKGGGPSVEDTTGTASK